MGRAKEKEGRIVFGETERESESEEDREKL